MTEWSIRKHDLGFMMIIHNPCNSQALWARGRAICTKCQSPINHSEILKYEELYNLAEKLSDSNSRG